MRNKDRPRLFGWAGPIGFTPGERKLAAGLVVVILVGMTVIYYRRLVTPTPAVILETHYVANPAADAAVSAAPASRNEVHSGDARSAVFQGDQLDINAADYAELLTLPGIGPVLAARIIAYRDQNGDFAAVDSLLNVSGIGLKKLDRLRARICVR